MKIKLWWIIVLLTLITVVGYVIPRLKYWFPSSGPSASEPARPEQATPDATVNAVFQMVDQGEPNEDNPKEALDDRLDDTHLFSGQEMTPDEKRFAGLFLENQRSAAIYHYLRANLAKSATITGDSPTGDTVVVSVALQTLPDKGSDWEPSTCTVELKKRGPNWYVDELKSSRMPTGVFATFRQRFNSTP
jgi:hypothetical protein